MPSDQLNLIRQYCDTAGIRLSSYEKDLLCMILENPSRYDGFTSKVYIEEDSDRDYRDTWYTCTKDQYRINIDSSLSIDQRHRHQCDDGFDDNAHWEWHNAWHITDTRQMIKILKIIESEL